MNAIVVTALKRPYTFVVLAILITFFGIMSVFKTPTDVFPTIRIPVVSAVWSYSGLMPYDVSGRITGYYERALTATVEGIEHMESNSYYGRSIINIYFQPGTEIGEAEAQVTALSQTIVQQLPPGISPPLIMKLEASSVPVVMLQITSDKLTPSELYNISFNQIRTQLVTVEGAIVPHPYGGKPTALLVYLNQDSLQAKHLSAMDVYAALDKQNVVIPSGDEKIGSFDFMVQTNATPFTVEAFNNIPIKRVGNAMVYIRDVAHVQLGGPPQTNSVLVGGKQAVMVVVMKGGEASTLSVVSGVKEMIPHILRTLPKESGIEIKVLNDASEFVRDSVSDVLREMVTASALTGLVVLLFLGSWRSTVIIATSIPLAMFSALIGLGWAGQTINVMTLGGLALAVGILVDDATVMIENIDSHLEMGKDLETAIIDAANQIVIPTFVSTLCISIVWLPLFQLSGVSGWLFMPMAEAIIFAMIASFILSRTLVPTMANWLLKAQVAHHHAKEMGKAPPPGFFGRFQIGFEKRFITFREGYKNLLNGLLNIKGKFILIFLLASACSLFLLLFTGRDFFPEVKSSSLQMHMRTPLGTRIEEAGNIAGMVDKEISALLPGQIDNIIVNCGLPVGPHNQAFIPTPTIGAQDCDMTISLKNHTSPVAEYRQILRDGLNRKFPGTQFSFQPADLTAKILDFGLPAPIDVQVIGLDLEANFRFAQKLSSRLRTVTGIADVNIQQTMNTPTLRVNTKRSFSLGTDVTEDEIANNALITLSGSGQVHQSYWLDPKTGFSYMLNIYTPQRRMSSVNDLQTIPIDGGDNNPKNKQLQMLGSLSDIVQLGTPGEVSHYNIIPVIDIYASNEGRDLGGVVGDVSKIVKELTPQLPYGSTLVIRGQSVTMNHAYIQLIGGLGVSILLVYLLIVVNFQSWLDPFVIIMALPGALGGIAWSLFLTHTTLSVPALTGAIMCMGTATSNAILVVAFARERLESHGEALRAALEAGYERIRPVLMTASAMIVGMLPMSMSNSQNAPLGRAVIGGLMVATVATLLFVPCVFALVHSKKSRTDKPNDSLS
ncbi:efflux RND transporter permease subunit [Entomobacter blattae]|uniref:Cobalt-zinc-cadmium resistance protein CzcA n=1 Tax=Entomobacter blattae TaxID=2762277 RepID=A0A7H1NT76_9PROT|nr:efflux RND transporter permease subunit [Entomobacter blattae]QNT78986.1 Cobalt-zinc-cadmium resistance protein CzcA [Entomobacter blattae]